MDKTSFFHPNINKGCLHTWHHSNHFTFINITHDAAAVLPLNTNLLEHTIFHQRNTGLHGCDID